jgi:hypothetical protein
MAVQSEADQIPGPNREVLIEGALLRDIANLIVASMRLCAIYPDHP